MNKLFVVALALFAFAADLPSANSAVLNPSFENSSTTILPSNWSIYTNAPGDFGMDRSSVSVNFLPTDGFYSGRIYSSGSATFTPTGYGQMTQSVNLTAIDKLIFDASLDSYNVVEQNYWNPMFEASFLVGGVEKWTSQTVGNHLNIEIDVSSLVGLHVIEFRNASTGALITGSTADQSNWFMFDNIRTVTASPVPLPAALPLLMSVLGFFGFLGWRRKAVAS